MMSGQKSVGIFLSLWIGLVVFGFRPDPVLCENIPTVNSFLPEFKMESPASENEKAYLGIGSAEFFSIQQMDSELLMIEIVGVYCPQCHIQMPLFNDLFQRIKRDPLLCGKIKVLAIAIGANEIETAYFRDEYHIDYPVIKDTPFTIHKGLGEPRTPFTMLVTRDKKVVFAHLGVIRDMDKFFLHLKGLLK